MNFFALGAELLSRLPIEKIFIKEPDRQQSLKELRQVLESGQKPSPVKAAAHTEPHVEADRQAISVPSTSSVSTAETIAYQNREIAKLLLRIDTHCVQKWRINGKVCDCGATKHFLDLESLCEETIPMASDPTTYHQILAWGRDISPKCTVEAVSTGNYDEDYATFAHQARDFRKQIMGSSSLSAVFPVIGSHEKAKAEAEPEAVK